MKEITFIVITKIIAHLHDHEDSEVAHQEIVHDLEYKFEHPSIIDTEIIDSHLIQI